MRLLLILVIVTIAVVVWSVPSFVHSSLAISPVAARRQRFSLIIDVRTPKERETLGFYPNSIPIPLASLMEEVPFLIGTGPAAKQKDILVYSNGDPRAQVAAETLHDAGFTRVRYITTTYNMMLPPHH